MSSTTSLRFSTATLLIFILILVSSCNKSSLIIPEGFELEQGYSMALVASEPIIKDPVDLEFDEHGDPFVLEMPGYPFEDRQSRILKLKDTNKDGTYDSKTVYAEQLELASSIMPYKQGFLVAAPPYLLFLKDTDSDDIADLRDTIMTGFSTGNLQHNYNGLTFGIDNWVYAANGGNSGNLYWYGDTIPVMDLREDDIRIDIENRIVERVGQSSGGYELGIDEYGRIFGTHNLEHISQIVYPSRYSEGCNLSPSHTLSNISDHEENGLARIYPIGEQESRVNHPEQSGYFSGACGITYYGGGALGSEYDQTIWIADVVLNLIHVDKLSLYGSSLKASRTIHNKDFLASSDRSFRPVNLTVGPDGSMYVIDMHRKVIEHPEWIPDDIEKTLDLESGNDKGRIYKISDGEKHSTFNHTSMVSVEGLINNLEHPNQWVRNTAHRLMLERVLSTEDIDQVTSATKSKNVYGRLHSMWILHTVGAMSSSLLIEMLNDEVSGIRENALILTESYISDDEATIQAVINLLSDSNQRVRMQAALTLSTLTKASAQSNQTELLDGLIASSKLEMDQWNAQAISLAGKDIASDLFKAVIRDDSNTNSLPLLSSLATISANDAEQVSSILQIMAQSTISLTTKVSIIDAISKHISSQLKHPAIVPALRKMETMKDLDLLASIAGLRKKLSLPASPQFLTRSKKAIVQVADRSQPEDTRLKNMALISLMPYKSKSGLLFSLLSNKESLQLQEQALIQLGEASAQDIGVQLVDKWKDLGPQSRRAASDILLYNENYHDALLTGLENGVINIGEMNFDLERRRTLLWWTENERTKSRANALFSDAGVVNRKVAIDKMKSALALSGVPKNGIEVFKEVCAQCHVYGEIGTNVGPILTEISRKSKESLLHDILDPNAAVDTKYINHRIETSNGTHHIGMIDRETDNNVTIKKMGGASITIDKVDMKSFTSLGTSMMLEGLEGNMSHQDMADLLAYLQHGVD